MRHGLHVGPKTAAQELKQHLHIAAKVKHNCCCITVPHWIAWLRHASLQKHMQQHVQQHFSNLAAAAGSVEMACTFAA